MAYKIGDRVIVALEGRHTDKPYNVPCKIIGEIQSPIPGLKAYHVETDWKNIPSIPVWGTYNIYENTIKGYAEDKT